MDVNVLKQINPLALSRLIKLWVPWWVVDVQNRVESLGYSKSSARRTGDGDVLIVCEQKHAIHSMLLHHITSCY